MTVAHAALAAASEARAAQAGATETLVAAGPAACLVELPLLRASGDRQMGIDEGLLEDADPGPTGPGDAGGPIGTVDPAGLVGHAAASALTARRYLWSPPAVSLGRFQELSAAARSALAGAGLDVVRRPSGGRLVLHGEGFEWSFAVVWPAGALPFGTRAPYRLVRAAMAGALSDVGVAPDDARDEPYTRSPLCFASALRHDLLVAGTKAVAVAQCQRDGRCLVHGSVLERRPPAALVAAVEAAVGQPWEGAGLAGAEIVPDGATLWAAFVDRLAGSHDDGSRTPVARDGDPASTPDGGAQTIDTTREATRR